MLMRGLKCHLGVNSPVPMPTHLTSTRHLTLRVPPSKPLVVLPDVPFRPPSSVTWVMAAASSLDPLLLFSRSPPTVWSVVRHGDPTEMSLLRSERSIAPRTVKSEPLRPLRVRRSLPSGPETPRPPDRGPSPATGTFLLLLPQSASSHHSILPECFSPGQGFRWHSGLSRVWGGCHLGGCRVCVGW